MSTFTGGRRFVSGDPFLLDKAEIWRWQTASSDEGTPTQVRVKVASVDCRIDHIKSRRSDLEFRTNVTTTHQNFSIVFLPSDTDIKLDDVLRVPKYNEQYYIVEISRAIRMSEVSHLECAMTRITGEV